MKIAIDGPAGAGKSTIAKLVSNKLGILYLDTGAMYRAIGLAITRKSLNISNIPKILDYIKDIDIKINFSKKGQEIFLNNENVTSLIRNPEISIIASDVSAIPEVRIKLVDLQRKIASENSVIMDGRDIGTYVLPDADLKIYLNAGVLERAKRRYHELIEKGYKNTCLEEVLKDIEYRDKNDSERSFAPLKKAEDAIEIDTTHMSIDNVVNEVLKLVNKGI